MPGEYSESSSFKVVADENKFIEIESGNFASDFNKILTR